MERFRSYREYLEKQDRRVVFGFTVLVTGFVLFSAIAVTFPFSDRLFSRLFPKDQSFADTNKKIEQEATFYSNELLIKVKKSAKAKVKENPGKSGLAALDRLDSFQKVKKIEKLAKANKKSKTDADIFSWYHVQFDGPNQVIKGKFDAQSQDIAADHASGRLLRQLIAELKTDPDIEAVEPNFVVKTTQTGCETQMSLALARTFVTVAPGGQFTNTLSVTNNGTSSCGPINISATFPGGWSQVLNPGTVTVAPGQTVQVGVTVNTHSTTTAGTYTHYLWLGSYGAGSVGTTVQVSGIATTPTLAASPSGYMRITYPNGGEQFTAGETVRITWDTNVASGCNLLYVTQATGPTVYNNIGNPNAATKYFDWKVAIPTSLSGTQQEKIAIICSGAPQDYSDNFFTVSVPTPTATPQVTPGTPASGSGTPNDPYYLSSNSWGQGYADLYGIKKINAEGAWQQTTGSTSIIVADIDTGVDRNHPDLQGNMWVNSGEVNGNGIDDDANGYVDDYYGWDFLNNDNDPMDDHGHGTHTVGTIAASGNNGVGVVGVTWNSKVMALKFLGANGSGSSVGAVRALQYAADMGARVSSNSWSCDCITTYYNDAIKYEHDRNMVVVVAAGNSNADAITNSPAGSDKVITVAASDAFDKKAGFSNWGEKIDVAAPGVDTLSTRSTVNPMCTATNTVGGSYCRVSGTSMATPHVAGLAALLLSKNPNLTNEEVRQIIRTSADDLGMPGKDRDFGYGRINAAKTLTNANVKTLTPVITSPQSRTSVFGSSIQIMGAIGGENLASYKVEVGNGRTPTTWTEIASGSHVTNNVFATAQVHNLPEGYNIFKVTATTSDGRSYHYQVHDIFIDNVDALLNNPVQHTSRGSVQIKGTALTKNSVAFSGYRLEWGMGTAPTSWSTDGISLVNNGSQAVQNGVLGTWDTSGLTDGQTYSLRLVVTGANGVSVQDTRTTQIDKDLAQGWPLQFKAPEGVGADPVIPVLVDLEGDGAKEVVVTDLSNGIWAYRKDGSVVPGFPFKAGAGQVFDWHVNAVDLDKDGTTELIGVAQQVGSLNSRIYIVKSNGTAYPGWPVVMLNLSAIFSDGVPAVADLDRNGTLDLVTIDRDPANPKVARLHAFNQNGVELAGFPKMHTFLENVQWNGIVNLADLDKDGVLEIAYGNDKSMYLFDNTGNLLPGWPFTAPLFNGTQPLFMNSAATGDIDGDGALEMLAVASDRYCSGCNVQLYGFKKNGSVVTGFPQSQGLYYYEPYIRHHTASLGDIDGDGKDEIFAGLQTVATFDGAVKRSTNFPVNADTQVALADANADGYVDMAVGSKNELNVTTLEGTPIFKKILSSQARGVQTPVLADLDSNGKTELSVTHFLTQVVNGVVGDFSTVYLYELPSTSSTGVMASWPMFNNNAARTGWVKVDRAVPTATLIPSPTLTTVPSNTPTPTLTPRPTNTPTPIPPTATPLPTATPTRIPTSTPVPDTTPPSVTITSPTNNATVRKSTTVTITANATDTSGIARVEFYVNNVLTCTDTTSAYTCAWRVPSKARVLYTLQARAYDTKGNSSSSFVQVTSR